MWTLVGDAAIDATVSTMVDWVVGGRRKGIRESLRRVREEGKEEVE